MRSCFVCLPSIEHDGLLKDTNFSAMQCWDLEVWQRVRSLRDQSGGTGCAQNCLLSKAAQRCFIAAFSELNGLFAEFPMRILAMRSGAHRAFSCQLSPSSSVLRKKQVFKAISVPGTRCSLPRLCAGTLNQELEHLTLGSDSFTRAIELKFGWFNTWLGDSKVVILLKVTFDHSSHDEYESIRQLRGNRLYFYEAVQDPTTLVEYIGKGVVQGIGSFPHVFFSRK